MLWQLRKLSTNEALSKPGPLPNNWGPIFGLHGFQEKLDDLSWLGSAYADQGWFELTNAEQKVLKQTETMALVEIEKGIANAALSNPAITVAEKMVWDNYLLSLDTACLCSNFAFDVNLPVRPDV